MKPHNRHAINISALVIIVISSLIGLSMTQESGTRLGDAFSRLFGPYFLLGGVLVGVCILLFNNWHISKKSSIYVASLHARQSFFSYRRNALLIIAFPVVLLIAGYGTSAIVQGAYDAKMLELGSPFLGLFNLIYGIGQIAGIIGSVILIPMIILGIAVLLTGSSPRSAGDK